MGAGLAARSVLLGYRFAAGPQQPAFPHVSPPRDAQMVHDAMVQDVIPLIVEPGRELIQLRRTSGAGPADNAGCVPLGAFEVNPLIAHLIALFGRVGGVVLAKGIALVLALGVRKRLWMANLFYVGVICWNLFVLIAVTVRRH